MRQNLSRFLPSVSIALFFGALYYRTLAPGLTWANDGADGGDFLAALATGGVPHPGGYPTYMLLATAFSKLSFGSLAFRMNVFSLLTMLAAILFFHQLALSVTHNSYLASFSSVVFGSFPLIWSQAIITEVYSLQTLLVMLVLLLFLSEKSNAPHDVLGGALFGAAIGNHLTSLFLIPILFMRDAGLASAPETDRVATHSRKAYRKRLLDRLLGMMLGMTVFLSIPVRASNHAPINWGYPLDWNGFWWVVTAKMYQSRLLDISASYLISGLQEWAHFLLEQLGILGLAIGLLGLVMRFRPTRFFFWTSWLVLTYSAFSILYRSPDSYVYLIPALISFALWMGMGMEYLIQKLRVNSHLSLLAWSISILWVITQTLVSIPQQDVSQDHTAEEYARAVLSSVPETAIVVTHGDESLFSLWYFHYAEHQRPDVAIISADLLPFAWYVETLEDAYPGLNIPVSPSLPSFARLNANRPVCELASNLNPKFNCLP